MSADAIEAMIPHRGAGGVVRWSGPRPVDEECIDCGALLRTSGAQRCMPCANRWRPHHEDELAVQRLMRVLDRTLARSHPLPLCDCGCLLRTRSETCPSCLVWAERNAARTSWRRGFDEREVA